MINATIDVNEYDKKKNENKKKYNNLFFSLK